MPLKFAPNLSTMFKEDSSLLDRFQSAKNCGFKAVECQAPYDYLVEDIAAAKKESGLEHILINSYSGSIDAGEFGFAAKPHYETEFKNSIDLSVKYAKALGCKRIHILAGVLSKYLKDEEAEEVYIQNIQYAVDVLSKENITALIEPITQVARPNYFLSSFDKAVEYIKKIDSPYLKLQLDLFHLQMISGNLTNNIKDLLPYVDHVQISQVPHRHEPHISGEIDFQYIFSLLENLGYNGWIGLEYNPKGNTKEGLKWIEQYGYKL